MRLGDVANVRISPNPNVINRQAISRYVDVTAGVDGRGVGAVSNDVESRLQGISLPLAYHAEVLAPVEETPTGQLIALGVAAAIGVFLLLQAAFGRWGMGAVAFVTLPLALAGGALGALAAGGDVSIGSLMGFIAVLGIAARNTVLMITRFQRLELEEGETFGPQPDPAWCERARHAPDRHRTSARCSRSCRSSSSGAGRGTSCCIRWPSSSWAGWSPRP